MLLFPLVLAGAGLLRLALPASPVDVPDEAQRRTQYLAAHPALGEPAPDFVLRDLEGKEFRLRAWAGKRPVVIEFGSYT
jgi:hypothetical protein